MKLFPKKQNTVVAQLPEDEKAVRSAERIKRARRGTIQSLAMGIVLMLASCVLFLGTTLAWFTDSAASGNAVIRGAQFSVGLSIGGGSGLQNNSLQDEDEGTLSANSADDSAEDTITLTRIDSDISGEWEPGAVFVSDIITLENPGDMEIAYRVLTDSTFAESSPVAQVIDYRIIDVESAYYENIHDYVSSLNLWNDISSENTVHFADCRADTENTVEDKGEIIRTLAPVYGYDEFYIVARMRTAQECPEGTDINSCMGRSLDVPFRLIVQIIQSDDDNTNTFPEPCTGANHEAWLSEESHGSWQPTEDGYEYICSRCGEVLKVSQQAGEGGAEP